MTEAYDEGSTVGEPVTRIEMSRRATEYRRTGELDKALTLYREMQKSNPDAYSAAGLLHCLRKLHLFDEALPQCTPPTQKYMVLDWYRNEVIWTLIQGKLNKIDSVTPVQEIVSTATSILALEPRDSRAIWRTLHPVLKTALAHKNWNVAFEWSGKITPAELSSSPMKDDRGRDGWCEQAIWYNYRIRSMIEVGDKEHAVDLAINAASFFPHQAKFFKRLEALALLRLGRFVEAELIYAKLTSGDRPDWWLLKEHGHALRELGKFRMP